MTTTYVQKTIAQIISISLAISPLAPAYSKEDTDNLVNSKTSKEFRDSSRGIRTLEERLRNIEQSNTVQQEMMTALTKMLKNSGQLSGISEDQKHNVTQSIDKIVDEEAKKLMGDIANSIKKGDWVKGLENEEIISNIKELTKKSNELKRYINKQRDKIGDSIESVCGAENPQNWPPLSMGLGMTNIPSRWSTDFSVQVQSLGIKLPACFDKTPPNSDTTVTEDINNYEKTLESGQELQSAISNMMMMAISTGNPYVIAAAMLLIAIMAIFSDGGGDGDGSGDADGSGNGKEKGKSSKVNSNSNDKEQQDSNDQDKKPSGNSDSNDGIQTSNLGSIQVTRQGDDSLTFFDSKKSGRPFILQWNRIRDTNSKKLPKMPPLFEITKANINEKTLTIKGLMIDGAVCKSVDISPDDDKRGIFVAVLDCI